MRPTDPPPDPRTDPADLEPGRDLAPSDRTLLGVLRNLDDEGRSGQFRAVADAMIQCLTCRRTFPAARVHANDVTRLEGASDPADMMMVVPVRCPHCGTAGSLVLGYGPDAGSEDADVVAALSRQPSGGRPAR